MHRTRLGTALVGVVLFFLAILVGGCKGYDEHEKLTYLDDVDMVLKGYSEALEEDPEIMGHLLVGKKRTMALGEAVDQFRQHYQGKAVDKDLAFLARLEKLQDGCELYALWASPQQNMEMARQTGRKATPEADLVKHRDESKAAFKALLEEADKAAKEARK